MKKTELTLLGSDNFFISEAYKVLRTNLQFSGEDIKVITFTSCNENEGKTTTVLNLGKSFADLDKKVLVIDADLRKSVMASRNSDAVNVKGLSDVLSGMEKKEDCIYNTQFEGLDIIFAGWICPNPVELLSSNRFKEFIDWAKENYDYVLIDTAPLGVVIDAAVVGPLSDGVAVLMSDKVRYSQAKNVMAQLKKSESKIIGVIRNRVGKGSPHSGYYSKYGKYSKYSQYSKYIEQVESNKENNK